MRRLSTLLLVVLLGVAPSLMAATGSGIPSRPRFLDVRVGLASHAACEVIWGVGNCDLSTALAIHTETNISTAGNIAANGEVNGTSFRGTNIDIGGGTIDLQATDLSMLLTNDGGNIDIVTSLAGSDINVSPNDSFLVDAGGGADELAITSGAVSVNGSLVCTANGANCPAAPVASTGTFTITWDDACTTSPTSVVDYVAIGNLVTLVFRSSTGFPCTSDSVSLATSTAIVPVAIRPAASIASNNMFAGFTNNGTLGFGCLSVFSGGTVQFSFASTGSCGSWVNSGNKALVAGMTFSYIINDP